MEQIPVISINLSGLESNSGLLDQLTVMVKRGMFAIVFGDLFMRCLYRMRPYEKVPGSANALHRQMGGTLLSEICIQGKPTYRENLKSSAARSYNDFDDASDHSMMKKPKVGVVGEILVKFLPAANNYLVDLLEAEGAQAVVPDLMDFLLYCFYNAELQSRATSVLQKEFCIDRITSGIALLEWLRGTACKTGIGGK